MQMQQAQCSVTAFSLSGHTVGRCWSILLLLLLLLPGPRVFKVPGVPEVAADGLKVSAFTGLCCAWQGSTR
jgi:hypothetical protein